VVVVVVVVVEVAVVVVVVVDVDSEGHGTMFEQPDPVHGARASQKLVLLLSPEPLFGQGKRLKQEPQP